MYNSADVTWTLVAAFMVFFMQAGFALCEAGLTRAKNTGNILMKNMMDFCIGTPCFWIVGFGLMFGGTGALIGGFDPFIRGSYDFGGLPLWVYVVFQTVFCATAATIVSGSMAERTKFSAYCVYSAAISLIVYPISGHWIWGGGWLAQLGFHDFAGSTAVHFVGGVTACLDTGMHKVTMIVQLAKFDALKQALNKVGVTGMTVTQVMGCGLQKGSGTKYRGAEVDATLLPKVKVEVVVSKIPVDTIIDAATKALYTGHIGDGKIFVYNVAKVVKVRTGEQDYAALQDVE